MSFKKKIGIIKKDAKNPHFKNTYATLKQVLSEVKPVLTECGIMITQPIKDGMVSTLLHDSKGNLIADSSIALPINQSPQQLGSAITYYRRYTLCSLLSLEIDDDDDGQQASKPMKMNDKEFEDAELRLGQATNLIELTAAFNTLMPHVKADEKIITLAKKLKEKLK